MSFAAIANLVVFVLLAGALFNFRKPRLTPWPADPSGPAPRGRLRPCPAVPLRQRRCRRERNPHLDQRGGLGLHQLAEDGHHAARAGDDDCRRGAHPRGGGSWTHRRQRGAGILREHHRRGRARRHLREQFHRPWRRRYVTQGARELRADAHPSPRAMRTWANLGLADMLVRFIP